MSKYNINNVVKVKEVDSEEHANELLDKGWVLLAAAGVSSINGIHGTTANVLYSLGKTENSID